MEYHLSGGVFFNLILASRKTPAANQEECLRELLYIFDRSARGLSGNSLKTITSRFRNCDQELNSEYLRFGDAVTVDSFNSRIKDNYDGVVQEMKAYADKYLDVETNGRWLVKAIMELIESDTDIKEYAKFIVIPGATPIYRDDVKDMKVVYFYNFILGVWHYICSCDKAENGLDTYWELSEFVSDSRPRKLKKEKIGFKEKYEDIVVSYNLDLAEREIRATGLVASYLEGAGKSTVIRTEKDSDQIFGGLEKKISVTPETPFTIEYHQKNEPAALNRYLTYLSHAKAKHGMKKTFLYETQRPFYDFFVCNDVKKRTSMVGSGMGGSHVQEEPIQNISIDTFPEDQRCIILSGTGGLGKSMMMTHFMLDTIKKNGINGKVPIFVILRDYDPKLGDLIDFVFEEFKRHDTELRLHNLIELLKNGKGVILFDGLDEIKVEYRETFTKEVGVLADNYPDSMYIISSRPTMNFRAFERFLPYDLLPFNPKQSVEMIEKLDDSVIDPDTQRDFIKDLQCNRFKFNYEERTEFLGNPLFLTIMLLTYEGNHDIPTQRYLFYEQAYEAMAKKHDATKTLTREFATGLNSRDFQKYFGEFCAITYEQEKYDFTPEEIEEAFQEVILANNLDTTTEAFIEDVTGKICLIYLDGAKYYFVHRSFQEYFVAYFFSKQLEQNYDAILEMFMCRDEGDHDSMVLPMLFGMDQKKTELCVILPYLKQFEELYTGKEGYKHFLMRHYPNIYFEWGETDVYPENSSESSIYEFIINTYEIKEEVDGNNYSHLDTMIDKEYTYYDSQYDEHTFLRGKLVETYQLPNGYDAWYEAVNGEPYDIVGRSYEIDVMRAYENPSIYDDVIEVLESDDFPLMKEYRAVLKKYEELKAKYEKRTERKSFISRFH